MMLCYISPWQQPHAYMLVNGDAYTDNDVPEVVHHVDSENPNTHDPDEDIEEKVTWLYWR